VLFVVSAPEGEMLSQLPPLCAEALAVKLVALVALTDKDCDAGAAPPAVALKVTEVGATVTVLEAAFTTSVTAAVRVPALETTETVPL
jgi:hypothetical protein